MSIVDSNLVTARGAPVDLSQVPAHWRSSLPDYCALLAEANGLELRGGLFRVFGVGESSICRDSVAWNNLGWRRAYRLPETIILWGENIFGDQVGVDTDSGVLLVLNCEGGKLETVPYETPARYLQRVILGDARKWIEGDLVEAAERRGLRPSLAEHLSFALPLICGGVAEEENLEVMDAGAHLDVLGQIVEQMRGIPEGTKVHGFRS